MALNISAVSASMAASKALSMAVKAGAGWPANGNAMKFLQRYQPSAYGWQQPVSCIGNGLASWPQPDQCVCGSAI